MTKKSVIMCVLALTMFALVLGSCSPQRRTAGAVVSDAEITAKVKANIAQNSILKAFRIDVTTYRGVVQLSGFVDSPETVKMAGEAAQSVNGVKSVRNDLIVKPPPPPPPSTPPPIKK